MIHTTLGVGPRRWLSMFSIVVAGLVAGCWMFRPSQAVAGQALSSDEPPADADVTGVEAESATDSGGEPMVPPAPVIVLPPVPAAPRAPEAVLSLQAPSDRMSERPPAEADARRPLAGPVAGALTALVPLAVGGVLWTRDDRPELQRQGARLVLGGFAAAPWVAHGVSGHWRRALAFGLGAAAASAAGIVAMETADVFNPAIVNRDRLPFGLAVTTAFFAAAAGVAQSFLMAPLSAENSSSAGGQR